MSESLDPRVPKAYRRRARVIVAFGTIQMLTSIAAIIDPALLTTSSAIQALDLPIAKLLLALNATAGLAAVVGVWTLHPNVERVGDIFLILFLFINALAIVINRGPVGGGLTATSLCVVMWVIISRLGDLESAGLFERRFTTKPGHGDRRVT